MRRFAIMFALVLFLGVFSIHCSTGSGGGDDPTCPSSNCQQSCSDCTRSCIGGNCQQTCTGGACNFSCSGGNCKQVCSTGAQCNFTCSGGNCQ
ncbi:MAG: hypothetical protein KC609_08475 [Myxococcales bacterium]|nr:hypothetical protein [Myxococcales bacterium]